MKVHSAQSNNLTSQAKSSHSRKVGARLANSALITFGIHVCANQPRPESVINLPQFALTTPATAQTRTINLPTPGLPPKP